MGRFDPCVEDPTMDSCDEAGCSVEDYLSAISVEAGKTYLFRVINAGGLVSLNLAIAGHTMTVVKADGTFVDPLEVSSLEVNLAQRYSVLVTMDQDPEQSYWVAAQTRGQTGFAYLQYHNSTPPDSNSTMPEHDTTGAKLDAMLFSKDVSSHPNAEILLDEVVPDRSTVIVTAQSLHPSSGRVWYTSNNVSNSLFLPKPLAVLAYEAVMDDASTSWPDTVIPGTFVVPDEAPVTWNYSNTPRDEGVSSIHLDNGIAVFQFVQGEIVEMVFQNTVSNRGSAGSHAWHLHGHEFYVIGQGTGTFDAEVDRASFNLVNPVLRDTFSVWDLGWTAIRFRANNPGVWPFHCTMAPHAVTGMGFNVITSPDLLPTPPPSLTSCFATSMHLSPVNSTGDIEIARSGFESKVLDKTTTDVSAAAGGSLACIVSVAAISVIVEGLALLS